MSQRIGDPEDPSPLPTAFSGRYVLVVPARNEEKFIAATLESICRQSVLPVRCVVVDDGSTDRTAEAAERFAARASWIEVLRRPPRIHRSFAGKAEAFNAGFAHLQGLEFEFVGSLDADVTFEPDYFEFLLTKFHQTPRLGVAGTNMTEEGYDPVRESYFNEQDVFGACQLFRRACFEEIGGYTPVHGGGIDWIAVRMARMRGWQTRCFMDKVFYHHRPMGQTESNVLRGRFEYGKKDYYLGNHPLWEMLRIGFQLTARPYVIGGLAIMAGYLYGLATRMARPLSPDLLRFHRQEQMGRLRALVDRRVRRRLQPPAGD